MDTRYITPKMKKLMETVLENSCSMDWEDAVLEWEIWDQDEDLTCSSTCICGHEGLRYLFTIHNIENDNFLYPIGSRCIQKFDRDDLYEEAKVREDVFKLRHAVENKQFLKFDSDLFSRKLLKWLYEQGAFDTAYNRYDGEHDYHFMLEMFNKRNKDDITCRQEKKIIAVMLNSIKPFILEMLKNKRPH